MYIYIYIYIYKYIRLNRICSENLFFDKRCNDLKIWLKGRRYSDKLVRKQMLKARKFSRTELLNNQKKKENEDKLVFNITYHPSLAQLKIIMTRISLLLTPDNEHNKVLRDVPIIGFRRAKSLKDILVRAKTPQIKNKGWCGPFKGPRCEICKHIVPSRNFISSTANRTYEIRPENLNCSSKNVVYLISYKSCHKKYTGSSEECRARFNNYRCAHRNYRKNMKVKQESFHAHFADGFHSGEGNWEVKLIDQLDSTEDLTKREPFWQHELDTFQSNGLNEHEMALF